MIHFFPTKISFFTTKGNLNPYWPDPQSLPRPPFAYKFSLRQLVTPKLCDTLAATFLTFPYYCKPTSWRSHTTASQQQLLCWVELKYTMPILMQIQKHYLIIIDNLHQQEILLTVELHTTIEVWQITICWIRNFAFIVHMILYMMSYVGTTNSLWYPMATCEIDVDLWFHRVQRIMWYNTPGITPQGCYITPWLFDISKVLCSSGI